MENTSTENKKGFLQNDRLLVCSMLIFYGFCILGLVGVAFRWLNQRNQTISANATATSAVISTQQANVTATAIAHLAELDAYEYIERFDKNIGYWFVGKYGSAYQEDVLVSIKDGVYIWNILDPKSFTQSADFYKGNRIKDFDVYVDSKVVKSSNVGPACSGLFFRRPFADWQYGAYVFTVCNDSHFKVLYYAREGWQTITYSDYENIIQDSDWNQLAISARKDHFTFMINNKEVFEMTDDRLKQGSLGIFVDIQKDDSAMVWFDNFGYQSR